MTGSGTLDFILGLAVLVGGVWLVRRAPVQVLRVVVALVVVGAALAACGTIRFDAAVLPAA